jgi:lipid A 3-O-deacylase
MAYRAGCVLAAMVCGGMVLGLGSLHAADLLTPSPDGPAATFLPAPTPAAEADSFEARLGAFAHSIGSTEAGGVDANVELLLPRLPNNLPEQYKFFVPRPQFGAMINTGGKTSYGYAGVVWTLNILPQFFLEPMFGGAVHDGNATATPVPDENTLGCRVLFHTGLSGGYRLTERWTALVTWDHISNGHLCPHNAGMNDYGVKIGYSF